MKILLKQICWFMCMLLPADAFATCYTVYDSSDKAVYKSPEPPFDMSISISDNIKSKYPGGYLLQDNSASCSLPKAGDVTHESINAEVKKRNSDPRSRNISVVSTSPNVLTQSRDLGHVTAREESTNSNSQGAARDPKCEELLNEIHNIRTDTQQTPGEYISSKSKRNALTEEYELRCLPPAERADAQIKRQLQQIQRTQQQMKQQQDHDKIWGKQCTPDGLGNLRCE